MKGKFKAALSAAAVVVIALIYLLFGGGDRVGSPSPEGASSSAESVVAESAAEDKALTDAESSETDDSAEADLDENGSYTSKEDVALYIHLYGKLPANFITKDEARRLGWDSREGNLDEVAPDKSIGGDRYGNYEKKLPRDEKYRECDINYTGGFRGGERIVYSDSGAVYYTGDHYNSFEQLY